MPPEADWVFDAFRLDPASRKLWRGTTGVPLRPKLFAALHYLVTNAGRLITREELLRAVWSRTHVDETLLRGTMRDLRAALGDDAEAPRFIETIPHQGYRFLPAVRSEAASPRSDMASPAGGASTPDLLERERELGQLTRSIDRALDRHRQIVFVTGEPGIGKTTLVDAFIAPLSHRHGVAVGRGQCVEQYGGSEPYLPVLEAVRQLCLHRSGKRVIAMLHQHAPTWLVQLPSLLTDAELAALQRKTQGAGRERMLREMAEALEALSVEMPVVLVFEDLHWSDHSTLDLLSVLARRREPARLLVVGSYRPADAIISAHPLRALKQELHGRGLCVEVPLGFLSQRGVAEMVHDHLGCGDADAHVRALARSIHARSDGNPLFVVNIINYLIGQGVIRPRAQAWDVAENVDLVDHGVPDGLRQLIERQTERLSVDDQRLLEAASVAGTSFTGVSLAAGLELPVDSVDERCDSLITRGQFLEAREPVRSPRGELESHYRFRHALYQRVLYDRIASSRLVRLHRRIGEQEEMSLGARAVERAAQLAVHFEAAHDHLRAATYLQHAAENALKRSAFREATAAAEHGVRLLDGLPPSHERTRRLLGFETLLCSLLVMTKGYAAPDVERITLRIRERAEQPDTSDATLPALLGMTRFHFARAELDVAKTLGLRCLELAGTSDTFGALRARALLTAVCCQRLELAEACGHTGRALQAYDLVRHDPRTSQAENPAITCLSFVSGALACLGYADRAREKIAESFTLATTLDIPFCTAYAHMSAAFTLLLLKDAAGAERSLDVTDELATRHGFSFIQAQALSLRARMHLQTGTHVAEAVALMERGLALMAATGTEVNRPALMASLADALVGAGEVSRALEVVNQALATTARTGALADRLQALIVKARVDVAGGSDAAAVAACDEAIALAQRHDAKLFELQATVALARLRHLPGRGAEPHELLQRTLSWFTEGFDAPDVLEARALLEGLDVHTSRAKPKARPSKR